MLKFDNKKVWFLFMLGVVAFATICLWQVRNGDRKVYANGRMVERENGRSNVVQLPFCTCMPLAEKEVL